MSTHQKRYQLQQEQKERHQQRLTPLQEAIERWVADELPTVPQLHKQTLRHLTQTPGGDKLFQFLTTRVHTQKHTETIRANLLLHPNQGFSAPVDSDDEVERLRQELIDAEQRLSRVRDKIQRKRRRKEQKLQKANKLQDGYTAIFPNTCQSTRSAGRTALTESLLPVSYTHLTLPTILLV